MYFVSFSAFEKQVLSLLVTIKQQNTQFLSWMSNYEKQKKVECQRTPIVDIPVQLPMRTLDDIEALEEFLKEDKHFSDVVRVFSFLKILHITTL